MTQLHAEPGRVRDELQSTIEVLQTTNEEMRASNEETVLVNEQLQSTSEELETSSRRACPIARIPLPPPFLVLDPRL